MKLTKILEFDWDKGNLDKSRYKHDVLPKEAESVFVSEDLKVLKDIKHSQTEPRYLALGRTQDNKNLFVVFTLRGKKVRIISARRMHKKEVSKYEKTKRNS